MCGLETCLTFLKIIISIFLEIDASQLKEETKVNTAPEIDDVLNEILKKVIMIYSENLLGTYDSCLREGKFFRDRENQKLVLLRKGVVNITTKRKKRTGRRERFCALISIDISNAPSSARWKKCTETMMRPIVDDRELCELRIDESL